jgi:hypothetical protein
LKVTQEDVIESLALFLGQPLQELLAELWLDIMCLAVLRRLSPLPDVQREVCAFRFVLFILADVDVIKLYRDYYTLDTFDVNYTTLN